MTPLQSASAYCANHKPEGCLGIGIRDNGSLFRLWPQQPCKIQTERCAYWETCVAPMIRTMDPGPARSAFQQAVDSYLRRLQSDVPSLLTAKRNIYGKTPDEELAPSKPCPGCQTPIPTRRRFCPKCAANHHRQSARDWKSRKGGSELIVNGKTPPDAQ